MDSHSKCVGILGGSFNPVHLGHLHIAKEIQSRFKLDEVWFIPAYKSPHKMEQSVVSPHHRINMLRLATQNEPTYKVLDVECKRKGPSYTVDTLKYLHDLYPENTYFLILGTDTVKRFHEWKAPHEIVKLAHLVVASRDSSPLSVDYHDDQLEQVVKKAFTNIPLRDVSSTVIRSLIRQGEEFQHLVPTDVYEYIEKNRLYRKS